MRRLVSAPHSFTFFTFFTLEHGAKTYSSHAQKKIQAKIQAQLKQGKAKHSG